MSILQWIGACALVIVMAFGLTFFAWWMGNRR